MDSLKASGYKHNPDVIKRCFKTTGDVITVTEDIKVIFPERYVAQELAYIGSTVRVVSILAIVDSKNNYGVMIAPVYIELSPMNITSVTIDNGVNKVLEFEKGGIFTGNRNLVRNEGFMYNLFDEFFLKGKIPWFLGYDHISDLLIESKKYAGSNIGKNPIAMEILTAIISRDVNDKKVFFRQILESNKSKKQKTHIGLNNIYYSFDNTASKLVGGYYGAGVTSAVINKEKETTVVADMLRA